MSTERYKCDRGGGDHSDAYRRYMWRKPWWCAQCGERQTIAGHRCQEVGCKKRVCCPCFDHLDAVCKAHTANMYAQSPRVD